MFEIRRTSSNPSDSLQKNPADLPHSSLNESLASVDDTNAIIILADLEENKFSAKRLELNLTDENST